MDYNTYKPIRTLILRATSVTLSIEIIKSLFLRRESFQSDKSHNNYLPMNFCQQSFFFVYKVTNGILYSAYVPFIIMAIKTSGRKHIRRWVYSIHRPIKNLDFEATSLALSVKIIKLLF